jgi:hypothetical protein
MPDVTQTEVGRRMYQLHKEKNVERAVNKVRETIGYDWRSFSENDVRLLGRMLGEAWVNMEQGKWDRIAFARMTIDDVRKILLLGKNLEPNKSLDRADMEKLKKIFAGLT